MAVCNVRKRNNATYSIRINAWMASFRLFQTDMFPGQNLPPLVPVKILKLNEVTTSKSC